MKNIKGEIEKCLLSCPLYNEKDTELFKELYELQTNNWLDYLFQIFEFIKNPKMKDSIRAIAILYLLIPIYWNPLKGEYMRTIFRRLKYRQNYNKTFQVNFSFTNLSIYEFVADLLILFFNGIKYSCKNGKVLQFTVDHDKTVDNYRFGGNEQDRLDDRIFFCHALAVHVLPKLSDDKRQKLIDSFLFFGEIPKSRNGENLNHMYLINSEPYKLFGACLQEANPSGILILFDSMLNFLKNLKKNQLSKVVNEYFLLIHDIVNGNIVNGSSSFFIKINRKDKIYILEGWLSFAIDAIGADTNISIEPLNQDTLKFLKKEKPVLFQSWLQLVVAKKISSGRFDYGISELKFFLKNFSPETHQEIISTLNNKLEELKILNKKQAQEALKMEKEKEKQANEVNILRTRRLELLTLMEEN